MEAYQKGDSKQMVAPLCAACEQCGKWRGFKNRAVKWQQTQLIDVIQKN